MDWVKFTRKAAPVGAKSFVTIQRKGTISLNRAAFEAMGQPQGVELLYDEVRRMIGLHPAELGGEGVYPVRTQASSNWLIAGTAFAAFWKIDTSVARRYEATMIDDVLAVDLNSEGVEVTGPRLKQPSAA